MGRHRRTTPDPRAAEMAALYRGGKTLCEIGQQFGVTRERIRQILTRDYGYRAHHGGAAERSVRRSAEKLASKNAYSIKRFGCSYEDYKKLCDMRTPTRRFSMQRSNARKRGIDWQFSLWQWWAIWQDSGHWADRGRGRGYAMCRFGDVGPYAPDNVYIATSVQNIKDYHERRRAAQTEDRVSA